MPVSLGLPKGATESAIDKVNDPAYTTAVGLALWGSQSSSKRAKFHLPNFSSVDEVVSKMKGWFKSLLP